MDRGAWWATAHGVEKSQTWLSNWAHMQSIGLYYGDSRKLKELVHEKMASKFIHTHTHTYGFLRWYYRQRTRLPMQKTWDMGLIPGSRRSPGEGNGNLLQYSWLENPMDRAAWQATVYGVAKNQTWLKQLSTCTHIYTYESLCCISETNITL